MIRRKFLRALSLFSFGLFVPKAVSAKSDDDPNYVFSPKVPRADSVSIIIRRGGKTWALGATFTDNKVWNTMKFKKLIRSNEDALWALDLIERPERKKDSHYNPDRPINTVEKDKADLYARLTKK